MDLTESVAKRVKELLKEKGMTQYALFKKTGVPQSTISTLLTGNVKTIKLCTIYEICKGLDIELSEFFNKTYLKQKAIVEKNK